MLKDVKGFEKAHPDRPDCTDRTPAVGRTRMGVTGHEDGRLLILPSARAEEAGALSGRTPVTFALPIR